MTPSERFIEAYWQLCEEHGYQIVRVYPDMYAALPGALDERLHLISEEEDREINRRRAESELRNRIDGSSWWWDNPHRTLDNLAKLVGADVTVVKEIVEQIETKRFRRWRRAQALLRDERTVVVLEQRYGESSRYDVGFAKLLEHPVWHGYREHAVNAIESAAPKPLPDLDEF